jgi:hypothetical protein
MHHNLGESVQDVSSYSIGKQQGDGAISRDSISSEEVKQID